MQKSFENSLVLRVWAQAYVDFAIWPCVNTRHKYRNRLLQLPTMGAQSSCSRPGNLEGLQVTVCSSTLSSLCSMSPYVAAHESPKVVAATFAALGFVVVKDMLTPLVIEKLHDQLLTPGWKAALASPALHDQSHRSNRGPGRVSASGRISNFHALDEVFESLVGHQRLGEHLREIFVLANRPDEVGAYFRSFSSVDFASGQAQEYQKLHSDGAGYAKASMRWSGSLSMALVTPITERWSVHPTANAPTRMVPFCAVSDEQYQAIVTEGVPVMFEPMEWLRATLELNPGDMLIRDPRCLHGGTPNTAGTNRSMIGAAVYSAEFMGNEFRAMAKPLYDLASDTYVSPCRRSFPSTFRDALDEKLQPPTDWIWCHKLAAASDCASFEF